MELLLLDKVEPLTSGSFAVFQIVKSKPLSVHLPLVAAANEDNVVARPGSLQAEIL
jgi:hypothetical protein